MSPRPSASSQSGDGGTAIELRPSEIDQIYACLSVGASLKDAAGYAGVSGGAVRACRRTDPGFARGLRQAVRRGKVHHLNKIARASAWQASVWILERRWRRQFGRQAPPEETRTRFLVERSAYDFSSLNADELRQLIALLGKAAKPSKPPATPPKPTTPANPDEIGADNSDTGDGIADESRGAGGAAGAGTGGAAGGASAGASDSAAAAADGGAG